MQLLRRPGPRWALVLLGGALAFGVLLLVQLASAKVSAAVLVAMLAAVLLPLTGHPRLTCLYLLLLCAPLGLRATFFRFPHMGGAGATFVDLIDPFLFALLFIQLRERLLGVRPFRVPPAALFWAGMVLLGVGTVVFGPLRTTAANETVRMFKLLLLLLVVANELVQRRQFTHVVIALTLGVVLQSAIAIAQYVLGRQLGLGFLGEASTDEVEALSVATLVTRDFVYRPSGLLGHANLLAGYLALLLPMAVALLLTTVPRLLKLLLALALALGLPALVLTLSRTGWIEYSIAFVLVLWLGSRHPVSRRNFMPARAVIVAVTLVGVLAMTPTIVQRLSQSDPTAVEYRLEWLHTAAKMVADNPVFGVGLNTYVYRQLPYGRDKTPEAMTARYGELWPAVHNSWALVWAEQGTVGFALWVAVHLAILRVARANLRIRDPLMHALAAGLAAGIVAIMIDGLASFFVRTEAPARMFWIAAGIVLAIGQWRRQVEEAVADAPVPAPAARATRWLPARRRTLR